MTITVSRAFVGRSTELGRLLAATEPAGQGQPAMVLLVGDAGVGKTRLLVELADWAHERGVQVLIGGCLELVGFAWSPNGPGCWLEARRARRWCLADRPDCGLGG